MTVAGLSAGAHVHERRCDPRPIEEVRALCVGDLDKPADLEVAIAGNIPQRYFVCGCGRMVRALFDPDGDERWACRKCHRLDYRRRHEGQDPVFLATELRKKLGGSGSLLEPLPVRPADLRAVREYDSRIVELLALEGRALQKLRKMSGGLEKYARRYR
jgi:hypothetical protein